MEIIYHGHSCVQIVTGGKSLLIDPFLRGNPISITKPEQIKTDIILLTHAHPDHISDAEPIARSNNAPIVAIYELATYFSWNGLQTIGMNIGGTVDLGFAKLTMIQAFHSSGIILDDEKRIIYAGMPAGFIIRTEGFTILHSGDTALYSDMKMIGERHAIDAAFIPIGDVYTMGPEDALQAAEWFNAKLYIPVHYNSFPAIEQDADRFIRMLEEKGMKGSALRPGQKIEL